MSYGDEWRKRRGAFHSEFRHGAVETHRPLQLRQSRKLVAGLLEHPEDGLELSRLYVDIAVSDSCFTYPARFFGSGYSAR